MGHLDAAPLSDAVPQHHTQPNGYTQRHTNFYSRPHVHAAFHQHQQARRTGWEPVACARPRLSSVPGRITCGTPNGEPTGGKLSAGWSIIAWQIASDDPTRVIGTMRILASGGDDCYKFSLLGKNYDYQPIDFRVPKCSSTPTDLIITSRDGQTWKQTFVLDARDPGWNCK